MACLRQRTRHRVEIDPGEVGSDYAVMPAENLSVRSQNDRLTPGL